MANCPRCNMFLAPGAQFCPNCQLNLMQYSYQQQQAPLFASPVQGGEVIESQKESAYKKILIAICFLLIGDLIIDYGPNILGGWFYSITRYLGYLTKLAWVGLPLFIAIVLSKKTQVRVLLIVLSSIYAAVSLYYWVMYEYMYSGFSDDFDYGY
jgi:hypothetical protein